MEKNRERADQTDESGEVECAALHLLPERRPHGWTRKLAEAARDPQEKYEPI